MKTSLRAPLSPPPTEAPHHPQSESPLTAPRATPPVETPAGLTSTPANALQPAPGSEQAPGSILGSLYQSATTFGGWLAGVAFGSSPSPLPSASNLTPSSRPATSREPTLEETSNQASVGDLLNADVFGEIMSHVDPTDRMQMREVCTQWDQWLEQGFGVPREGELRVPLLSRRALRTFLGSQEIRYARAIDAARLKVDPRDARGQFCKLRDEDLNALAPSNIVRGVDIRRNTELGPQALEVLSNRFPNLEYISLHACDPRILKGLSHLGNNSAKLKRIMLSHQGSEGCDEISEFLRQRGSDLESLCITMFDGPSPLDATAVTSLLDTIASSCPNLRHLSLPWNKSLTEEQLSGIVANCPDLKTLHLTAHHLRSFLTSPACAHLLWSWVWPGRIEELMKQELKLASYSPRRPGKKLPLQYGMYLD